MGKKRRMTPEELRAQEEMVANLINFFTDGNKSRFARILGIKPQEINSWLHGGIAANLRLVYKCFPTVNPAWLLSDGKGEMILPETCEQVVNANGNMSAASYTGDATVNISTRENDTVLMERIKGLEALVEAKDETIFLLRQAINNKESGRNSDENPPETCEKC